MRNFWSHVAKQWKRWVGGASARRTPLKTIKPPKFDSLVNKKAIVVCQISKNRKVLVRIWRGRVFIDIRDFYSTKNGKLMPTNRGISLPMYQWKILREHMEVIDQAAMSLWRSR